MKPAMKPIGYLIKELDKLLSKEIDRIQQSFGISRTGWQVINSISEAEQISNEELSKLMQPFVTEQELEILLQTLISDEIISQPVTGQYLLTERGVKLHQTCLEAQQNFRRKLMQNITEPAYLTTVQTLEKLTENIS